MTQIDPTAIEQWQRGECERHRITRLLLGTWHSHLPKLLGWRPSPWSLLFGGLAWLFVAILTLWPIWSKLYDEASTLTWPQAILCSGVLSLMLLYKSAYDRVSGILRSRHRKRRIMHRLSAEMRGIIASLSPYIKRAKVEHQAELNNAIRQVLQCICRVAQIHVRDYEAMCIDATLWVFDDPGCEQMRVQQRTTSSRPVGTTVKSRELMAYYVAVSRNHRVIQDFLSDPHPFPKTGLSSQGTPPYRSILLIPLLDTISGTPNNCVGVVSIDSSQAYQFWPGAADDLVQKVSPYSAWLTVLLKLNNPNCLSYPEGRQS